MTCHAVRFKCAVSQADSPERVPKPEPPTLPSVVPDRVKNHVLDKFEEVLPEQASEARLINTGYDGSGTDYQTGVRRFRDSEDKASIVDEVERNVVADAEWYVIESHVCDHNVHLNSKVVRFDAESDAFIVEGDVRDEVTDLGKFKAWRCGENNGIYTVASASYGDGETTVSVKENVEKNQDEVSGNITKTGCDGWTVEKEGGTVPDEVK